MSRENGSSQTPSLSKDFVAIMSDTVYKELLRFRRTNGGYRGAIPILSTKQDPAPGLLPQPPEHPSASTGENKPPRNLKKLNERMHGLNVRRW